MVAVNKTGRFRPDWQRIKVLTPDNLKDSIDMIDVKPKSQKGRESVSPLPERLYKRVVEMTSVEQEIGDQPNKVNIM